MTENLSLDLSKSRIVITGGSGFVGSSIARRLLTEGAGEVIVFDIKKDLPSSLEVFSSDPRLKVVAGDIRDPKQVSDLIKGSDYVFHQAALRVTQCAKEPRLAHEIMVDGTFNVAQACAEHQIKKVVHASSAIVYGIPLEVPLKEDHPLHDTTLYGVFKISNELLFRSYWRNNNIPCVALRYFNIFGPGMNLFGSEIEVLIRWLDRLDEGQAPLIFGDGKQTLDYIYIEDIVEANFKALLCGIPGEAYNVCTGKETSILELLELLLKVKNSRVKPEFREARAVNQVEKRYGCPLKAEKQLGFRSKFSLEAGLHELVKWREDVLTRQRS